MMNWRKHLVSVILVIAIMTGLPIAALAAVVIPEPGSGMEGQTVILHTNDTHGRAQAEEGGAVMGFSAVSALRKAYESAGANVLVLDAGDTLHGLPFATINQGAGVITLMNLAGYDAMTPGNHDFNYGSTYLLRAAQKMEFPLLSSNVLLAAGGLNLLQPSVVIDKNGTRYGLFGLSAPEAIDKTAPQNVEGLEFQDPLETARRQVNNLKAQNVDYIIALTHLGLDPAGQCTTKLLAEQTEGIDVIIDGHSHTLLLEGQLVAQTMIASSGEYLQGIGVVLIDNEQKITAGVVTLEQFAGRDTAVETAAARIAGEQEELLSQVVGSTELCLDGEPEAVRTRETNLGNLAADAVRAATGADIALLNGGGIRAGITKGQITRRDIVSVFPFGNYVVTKRINGRTLKAVLEKSVASYPEQLAGFLQVSGLSLTFDSASPAGSRVQEIKVGGKTISMGDSFLLATNDYLAAGGDGYAILEQPPVVNEFGTLEEYLVQYIEEGSVRIGVEQRIVDIQGPPPEIVRASVYVVMPGDSLWKIAKQQYGDGSQWTYLYELNRDVIRNPNQLRVGMELKLSK